MRYDRKDNAVEGEKCRLGRKTYKVERPKTTGRKQKRRKKLRIDTSEDVQNPQARTQKRMK